jgi:hypothetical protein
LRSTEDKLLMHQHEIEDVGEKEDKRRRKRIKKKDEVR